MLVMHFILHCFSACGGDGTVGWVLSVMDSMSFPSGTPAIGKLFTFKVYNYIQSFLLVYRYHSIGYRQ